MNLISQEVSEQYIRCGYGSITLTEIGVTYACMRVKPSFDRMSAINAGKRNPGSKKATQVGPYQHNGTLISDTVAHPNGTVILLQASWKRRGVPLRDGALFVRLRAGAAMYSVNARLPVDENNLCGEYFSLFSGYADIMNEEELALLGVHPGRHYTERFMADQEVEECFSIQELQAEMKPRPGTVAIATPEGMKLRELAQMPNRRIIIRRR